MKNRHCRTTNYCVTKHFTKLWTWTDSLVRFSSAKWHEIYHVECEGSVNAAIPTVATELVRYRLDLLGAQEVKLDKGAIVHVEDYASFYGKGNENHELEA